MEATEAAAEAKQQPTDEQRARAADAKRRGNEQYGKGEYEGALASYAEALAELPPDAAGAEAAALHSNSAMCHIKAERWDDAKASCTRALAAEPNNAKALLRRSLANERLDDLPGAHDDAEAAAKATAEAGGSLHNDALKTARRLKPLADAKREEMKEEVLGQLKDLGNSVLGWFGMSVDDFKAQQDPNTGGYSISFQPGGASSASPSN